MAGDNIRVLVISGYYLPGYKGGGPIKTIKNLIDRVGFGVDFKVVASDRDLGDSTSYQSVNSCSWNHVGGSPVFYIRPGFKGYFDLFKVLKKKDFDVVYLNSFFSPKFSLFPLVISRLLNLRVVLSPRGEFSSGALSLKSGKKQVFIFLYKALGFCRHAVFQASTVLEAEEIRRVLGADIDIQVAENIAAQEFGVIPSGRSEDVVRSVFISRISPKKNLLEALEMLRQVKSPLIYDIYGPIEDTGYWGRCEGAINTLPDHIKVTYKGMLIPEQVVSTLAKYDVFFFPTKGENYGHVIAEALCAGLPIVIADTTPWRNLQQLGIGWDLPLQMPGLFSGALDELASMPADQYMQMRERVLAWATARFSQGDAVNANIAMFRYAYQKN